MKLQDLEKINYLCGDIELSYEYILQCYNKNSKKEFSKKCDSIISKIFDNNPDMKSMLGNNDGTLDYIYKNSVHFIGGTSNKLYLSTRQFVTGLLRFICDDQELREIFLDYCNNLKKHFSENRQELQNDTYIDCYREQEHYTKDIFKDTLKSVRKKINETPTEDIGKKYGSISMLYRKRITGSQTENIFNNLMSLDLPEYKKGLIECINRTITYANQMYKNLYDTIIEIDEHGFDIQKYTFIIFSEKLRILRNTKSTENLFYSIMTYYNLTKEKDNSSLEYYRSNKQINKNDVRYTYNDFVEELKEYIKTNPNMNLDAIPDGFFDGWDENDINEFLNSYTSSAEKNFELLDPEYVLLPSESQHKDNSKTKTGERRTKKENLDLAIKKRALYDRNRNNIYVSLLGKNKFRGYVANVLNNGYVILEKYDEVNGCLSSKLGAAYIMNIDNFNDLSTKSVQELRSIVKDQPEDMPVYQKINYICHSGNSWEERIQAYFDQYTGISKKDIDKVVVNSSDRNLISGNNIIYKKTINK